MGRTSNKAKLSLKLRQKSFEAFMLCLEIYNKPTINYRIETSAFLLCNAWELMLKSHYVKQNGEKSIYRDSDGKTFSLEQMIYKYYQPNSPVRKNLLYIVENIRNKSTHLIIRAHDLLYTPLLQKAVLNFIEEVRAKFNIELTDTIPLEALALIVRKREKPQNLSVLYGKTFAGLYKNDEKNLNDFIQKNVTEEEGSDVVAIVESKLSFVKDYNKADILAYYDNTNGQGLQKITVSKDIDISHPFTMKQVIKTVKEHFNGKLQLKGLHNTALVSFNKQINITAHPELFAQVGYGKIALKKYSQRYIDLLIERIKQNPNLFA